MLFTMADMTQEVVKKWRSGFVVKMLLVMLVFLFGLEMLWEERYISSLYSRYAVVEEGYTNEERSYCARSYSPRAAKMSIVYVWTNQSEPCYRAQLEQAVNSSAQTQSIDKEKETQDTLLKYSLRSLAKFAPWHQGHIYILTPGTIPTWLDISHPRVHVVVTSHLLPSRLRFYTPVANSKVVERFMWAIPGVTDFFIQMSPEDVLLQDVAPEDILACVDVGGLLPLSVRSNLCVLSERRPQNTSQTYSVLQNEMPQELLDLIPLEEPSPRLIDREALRKSARDPRWMALLDDMAIRQLPRDPDVDVVGLHRYLSLQRQNVTGNVSLLVELAERNISHTGTCKNEVAIDDLRKKLPSASEFERLWFDGDNPPSVFNVSDNCSFDDQLLPRHLPVWYDLPVTRRGRGGIHGYRIQVGRTFAVAVCYGIMSAAVGLFIASYRNRTREKHQRYNGYGRVPNADNV